MHWVISGRLEGLKCLDPKPRFLLTVSSFVKHKVICIKIFIGLQVIWKKNAHFKLNISWDLKGGIYEEKSQSAGWMVQQFNSACWNYWQPDPIPDMHTHFGKRKMVPRSYPLASPYVTYVWTHTRSQINVIFPIVKVYNFVLTRWSSAS